MGLSHSLTACSINFFVLVELEVALHLQNYMWFNCLKVLLMIIHEQPQCFPFSLQTRWPLSNGKMVILLRDLACWCWPVLYHETGRKGLHPGDVCTFEHMMVLKICFRSCFFRWIFCYPLFGYTSCAFLVPPTKFHNVWWSTECLVWESILFNMRPTECLV